MMDADYPDSERYEETVGSSAIGPYAQTQALMIECPNCGAPVGVRCVAEPTVIRGCAVGRRKRRIPCIARLKAAEVSK